MAGAKRLGLPLVAGGVAALGHEPFSIPVFTFVGIAAGLWLLTQCVTGRQAAWTGWAVGLGYFAIALHWIVSPFLVDVARHGWMAPFAVIFLSAGLALFWALAFWGAHALRCGVWGAVLTLPVVETLRAYVFTGFPWATPAQVTVDGWAGQALAFVGPHGVNLLIVSAAALAVSLQKRARVLGLAVLGAAGLLLHVPPMLAPSPLGERVVRLVQPNAAQHEKWDPAMIPVFFRRQLDFTAAPPTPGLPAPDVVVWSETAIPWALNGAGDALDMISDAAGDVPVILGVQRRGGDTYYNSMVVLGPDGNVSHLYDKHHLVPFGEYLPLQGLAGRLGLSSLAAQFGNGYGAGPGPRVLHVAGVGTVLPLICYEAVFAHDVGGAPERADMIVHATNDAWFGRHAGPQQHLAQTRMRAIEQGLPVARAANTGISAVIDPRGRVLSHLPLGQAGYVDARLPQPLAPTLYSRTGDIPLSAVLFLAVACLAFAARARSAKDK
ncbi:apolipoprotein N-acyltransferase [Sulfitobacter sp. S190]|uniref:apolipoprotein N-acyltransferase n=1 Tax=Sulfitobacter sp. S190 TaxID=2867022 RepID=UPI0021A2CEE7|nr:apolipoprotein N-acyltransferase [Sulfitobacter sp. S190]